MFSFTFIYSVVYIMYPIIAKKNYNKSRGLKLHSGNPFTNEENVSLYPSKFKYNKRQE